MFSGNKYKQNIILANKQYNMIPIFKQRSHLLKFLLGTAALAFVILLLFWSGWNKSLKTFLLYFSWSYAICFTQWLGQLVINEAMSKRYDWKTQAARRSITHVILSALYSGLAFALVQIVMSWLIYHKLSNVWGYLFNASLMAVLISVCITLIYTSIGFFKAWKKSIIEAEQFKTEMLSYKYESLQNQINPHFLFNSFNVLSDLVYEDQAKAVEFIQQMSKLFRYVLDNRDKEMVPLAQEENFIKSFCFLLQNRFEDKLHIEIKLNAQADDMLIPMALQVLVENCVKHNIVSSKQPLHIAITRNEGYIKVVNNLQEKSGNNASNKIGLNNIKQQYKFFTNNELIIEKTAKTFEVSIPVLKSSNE